VALAGPVARIDLTALLHNYEQVGRLVGSSVRVLAMVKADAYGHGDSDVARALARMRCRDFGVATLPEAARLRAALSGFDAVRIVVFGGISAADARGAVDIHADIATQEPDVVRALAAAGQSAGREARVHVKVDTGMHRLGAAPAEVAALVALANRTRGVRPVALCSHFAMAESVTTAVTAGQLDALLSAATAVVDGGQSLPCHMANSAAILTCAEAHLDMVRPGLMLYGLYPAPELRTRAELRPVMTLAAPVVRIFEVGPGEGIGYGHSYRTERPSRIATLRCGYADGYPRALSNRGTVVIRGQRAPVVGRVCMDHTMVDVTGLDRIDLDDEAILWGHDPGAADVAAAAETISYELVARVGPRVAREVSPE